MKFLGKAQGLLIQKCLREVLRDEGAMQTAVSIQHCQISWPIMTAIPNLSLDIEGMVLEVFRFISELSLFPIFILYYPISLFPSYSSQFHFIFRMVGCHQMTSMTSVVYSSEFCQSNACNTELLDLNQSQTFGADECEKSLYQPLNHINTKNLIFQYFQVDLHNQVK